PGFTLVRDALTLVRDALTLIGGALTLVGARVTRVNAHRGLVANMLTLGVSPAVGYSPRFTRSPPGGQQPEATISEATDNHLISIVAHDLRHFRTRYAGAGREGSGDGFV